jgi:hypothetical protein
MSLVFLELTVVNINPHRVEHILVFLFVIWLKIFFHFLLEPINDLQPDSLLPPIHLILMHIKRTPTLLPPANIHLPCEVINNRRKEVKLLIGGLKYPSKNGVLVSFYSDYFGAYSHLVVDFLDKQVELADLGSRRNWMVVKETGGEGEMDGGDGARLDEQLFDK